jgi:hypothetical protein
VRKLLIVLPIILIAYVLLWQTGPVRAQGPSGYTKLTSVAMGVTSYKDTTCPLGDGCDYAVTSIDGPLEGISSNQTMFSVPTTAAMPNVQLTWVASISVITGYNIYRQATPPPNPPTGLVAVPST